MKERNLLYFTTATVVSILFLVSIILRFNDWHSLYGYVIPSVHKIIIPVALIWVGWYFKNNGFVLASLIILTILFGEHLSNAGVLDDQNLDFFVLMTYKPIVRTSYVISILLYAGSIGLGFFSYFKETQNNIES
ncbi:MAG: hypothetical protein RBT45_00785 [Acholeplasmataceae bacterium]|jgi:hypothetical protein|nr:hypothetical protein [Acholeplasmataceae bacterium]